jgi:uncharacterized protein (DUF3820 family)
MDQKQQLIELIKMKMPFGKYKGRYLLELPEPYLVWFSKQGFPEGKLGTQLQIIHEIKVNGTEQELYPILDAIKKGQI